MPRAKQNGEPHPVDIHIGQRMCSRRLQMGMNQSDLGRALGLTFQQVQKYEKGANRVSGSKLWDAGRALGVDPAYFYEGLDGTPEARAEVGMGMTKEGIQIAAGLAKMDKPARVAVAQLVGIMASERAEIDDA